LERNKKRHNIIVYLCITVYCSGGGESDDVYVGSIKAFINNCEIPLCDTIMFLTQAGFKVKKGIGSTLNILLNVSVEFPPPV
jgi:hypothetical protein